MALRSNIHRVQETLTTSQTQTCENCHTMSRCRRRDFSEQAWSVLLVWQEVQKAAVDQPICDDCYDELREVLIDRTDEIEAAVRQGSNVVEKATIADKKSAAKKPRKISKMAS